VWIASTKRSQQRILAGAVVGLVVIVLLTLQVVNPASDLINRSKTVTETSAVTITDVETPTSPAELVVDWVNDTFSQDLRLLGSGNVSAIVSQYEGDANVTWFGEAGPCFNGLYVGPGNITH
jgi:hypothetical protein